MAFSKTAMPPDRLPRTPFNVRMRADVAVYCDVEGRVLAVDLVTGRLMRKLEVR